jgi:hypothetical protein
VVCGITGTNSRQRKIVLGSADAAEGWTDGQSYIALERRWVRKLKFNDLGAFVSLGELLLHEYCHDDDDSDTHEHSPEFYALYHDASHRGAVATFASSSFPNMPKIMEYMERKMTKTMLRGQDSVAKLNKATERLAARSEP